MCKAEEGILALASKSRRFIAENRNTNASEIFARPAGTDSPRTALNSCLDSAHRRNYPQW